MTIEKTYKLTIKDVYYYLDEKELNALYEQCRKALNINYINDIPSNPNEGVKPTIPYPYDTYPWYPSSPGYPYWTGPTTTISSGEDNCVMDINWHTNTGTNQESNTGINFLSDDMKAIKGTVAEALSKLNSKNRVTGSTITNEGIKVR